MLRLIARAPLGAAQRLSVALTRKQGTAEAEKTALELDPGADPLARRRSDGSAVSREVQRYLVIEQGGRHRLVVSPDAGRALVRLQAARIAAPPRPPPEEQADPTPNTDAGATLEDLGPLPRVGLDPEPGPLTLGAAFELATSDLLDVEREAASVYGQLSLSARRAVVENELWLSGVLFHRQRDGPESQGAEVELWLASGEHYPGALASAVLASQELGGTRAYGGLARAGLFYSQTLTARLRWMPMVSYTLRRVDPRGSDFDAVDRTLYSRYAETRPRSLDIGATLDYRPYVDVLAALRGELRLAPDFDGIDRTDLGGRLQTMPGPSPLPWLRCDVGVSYRPVSPQRDEAFVRLSAVPALTFWHWQGNSHRFQLLGRAGYVFDLPREAGRAGSVLGQLVLGYDYVFDRGLTDFTWGSRPFRPHLEEGRGPIERVAPSTHHLWRQDAD